MSPHYGSAAREDAVRYQEALTDGVCLAIDHLHAMGMVATAEALLKRLFVSVDAAGAEGARHLAGTPTDTGRQSADALRFAALPADLRDAVLRELKRSPKAPPEEHILP